MRPSESKTERESERARGRANLAAHRRKSKRTTRDNVTQKKHKRRERKDDNKTLLWWLGCTCCVAPLHSIKKAPYSIERALELIKRALYSINTERKNENKKWKSPIFHEIHPGIHDKNSSEFYRKRARRGQQDTPVRCNTKFESDLRPLIFHRKSPSKSALLCNKNTLYCIKRALSSIKRAQESVTRDIDDLISPVVTQCLWKFG